MRLLHCLLALLPLVVAPLARADLIDDVWERGSLRIARSAEDALYDSWWKAADGGIRQ